MTKLKLGLLLIPLAFCFSGSGQTAPQVPVKEFVTKLYIHGLPYDQAKAYGKPAVSELLTLLRDQTLEEYWPNIVLTLGYIGDPSAVKPLMDFMENSSGEVSIHRFRAILRIFQALGHISQTGNKESIMHLNDYTSLNSWKTRELKFKFNQYSQENLSEVLARQAIVGLGISGLPEANEKLKGIKNRKDTRKDWEDNLSEAIQLNERVGRQGAQKVFSVKTN
ncbi:MAG TPA: hypothetical protein VGD17_18095 [Chitinophagaceae bacterium]